MSVTKRKFCLWGKHQARNVWGDEYYEKEYFDAVWDDRNEWYEIAKLLASDVVDDNMKGLDLMKGKVVPDSWGHSSPSYPMLLSEWNAIQGEGI